MAKRLAIFIGTLLAMKLGMKTRQLTIREMVRDNLLRMAEERRRNPEADQRLWQEQVEQLALVAEQSTEPELN